MDDYKRGIYMAVLRRLQTRELHNPFLCVDLRNTLLENRNCIFDAEIILNEFFNELGMLCDERLWLKNGKGIEIKHSGVGWWENGWYEPRIRALECILRDSA